MTRASLFLVCLMAVSAAAPAFAQDGEKSMLCHRRVLHNPASNVTAAPVDPQIITTTSVQIPLTLDLAKWLNLDVPTGGEGVLGLIELTDTGAVLYNGQDISAAVDAGCGTAPQNSTVTIDTDVKPAIPAPQPLPAVAP